LAHEVERQWKQEYADRLRADFPHQTASISAAALWEMIDDGWKNAIELQIKEHDDIYRFLKLRFLPITLLESDFIQSVLIRVLNNIDLPGAKRLDFIESQVIKPRLPDNAALGS